MRKRRKAVTLRFWMDADKYKQVTAAAKSWGHRTPAALLRSLLLTKLGEQFFKDIRIK